MGANLSTLRLCSRQKDIEGLHDFTLDVFKSWGLVPRRVFLDGPSGLVVWATDDVADVEDHNCNQLSRVPYSFGNAPKMIPVKLFHRTNDLKETVTNQEKFLREIDQMKRFNNPHVQSLFRAALTPSHFVLNLGTAPCTTLDKVIEMDLLRRWCPLRENLFSQVVGGVLYLHSQGVAHGTIMPQHILVDGRNLAVLINLSDVIDVKHSPMKVDYKGAAAYKAPELFKDEMVDPFKCDLYALGVLLFCMLQRMNHTEPFGFITFVQHCPTAFVLDQYIPILEGLLQQDPAQRWSGETLSRHLTAFNTASCTCARH